MSIACRHCQRANRDDATFCDGCGRRIATGTSYDAYGAVELRYGTFLFCDLVHSTALASRIDGEDLRRVFQWFRGQVDIVARQHEGHLIRFVGDGAFLSFGLPQASEDSPESAVRAGLGLVRAISSTEPIPGVRLALRVGIASGTVVFGDVIEEAAIKEDSIVGSVAHLAARLAAAASPNEVVIADPTRRAIGHFFECRDLGRLVLKGFEGGERGWQVIAETQIVSKFEAHHAHDTTQDLINCVEVMSKLNEAWAESLAGHGRAVILKGESGIGKSKVARTLRAQALLSCATVVEIDCTSRTRNTPLYPFSVLVQQLAEIRSNDTDTDRLRKAMAVLQRLDGPEASISPLHYLGPLFGIAEGEADVSGDSAERVREITVGLLVELLASLMQGAPLFMLCEDMHWADASSLLVVQRLCIRISLLPVLLVATLRPGPDSASIELENSEQIVLGALDDQCATAMIHLLTPADGLAPQIVERIIERAEGVPLFIEELCRSELDAVNNQPTRQSASQARATAVPQILQAIIEARLDRWRDIKSIIQAASVIGRDFPLRLLSELIPERSVHLPDAMARLVDAGLLTAGIDTRTAQMRFRHALIHEAVYETLLLEDRKRLHDRVAQLLVQHFDGLPESAPDLIAQHLIAAQRFEEAIVCLTAAGSQASHRAAYLESASHSRNGLALLEKLSDPRKRTEHELELLTQLGVAISATKGYTAPEVEATYRRARELVHDDPDPEKSFPGVRGLATYYFVRNEQAVSGELATLGLEMAKASGRIDFVIEALTVRGYTDMYAGRIEAAQAALQECATLYRLHGGETLHYLSVQDAGSAAWAILGMVCWLRGDSAGAEASIKLAIDHVNRLDRPFDIAYANCFIAQQLNVQRRHADAMVHATVSVELAKKHGFGTWLVCGLMQQAVAASSMAPSAEAVTGLRGAMAAYMGAGAQAAIPFFFWGLARGLTGLGDQEGARTALTEGLTRARETGELYLMPELLILASDLEPSDQAAHLLLKQAQLTALQQGAIILALRAVLTSLRRRGVATDDPQRDLEAWAAIEAQAPYPTDPGWARAALAGATQALEAAEGRRHFQH